MENNFYAEEISENAEANNEKNKKLIILFSVLAAVLPFILQSFLYPRIFEFFYNELPFSSFQMDGVGSLIVFVINIIMLVILVAGGYLITRTREGIIRFCGIFMFSSAIGSAVASVFNIFSSVQASAEASSFIVIAVNFISAVLAVFINVKLFIKFEYRTENRYITSEMLSVFRKKLVIFLLVVIAITLSGNVIVALIAASAQVNAGVLMSKAIIAVWGFVSAVFIFLAIYLIAKKVRNDKTDFIGFGASYYLARIVTTPFTQLVTGLVNVSVNKSGSGIQLMIVNGSLVVLSLITGVFSLIVMFNALRIFFPVRDAEITENTEDRAEQILKNLIESKKSDT